MRRINSAVLITALLAVNITSLTLVWQSRPALPQGLEEVATQTPVAFKPLPTVVRGIAPAALKVGIEPGPVLVSPAWDGMITAVHVRASDVLRSGDPLIALGAVDVVVLASQRPFFRILKRGQAGEDVADLENALGALGLDPGERDGRFDRVLETAVRTFNEQLGVVPATGRFNPALVVWLPSAPFVVGSVDIHVGVPAPPPGAAVVAGAPRATSAKLADESVLVIPGAAYVAALDDVILPLDSTGAVAANSLARIDPFIGDVDDESQLTVQVRLATPINGFAVPGSAVVPIASGFCVIALVEGVPAHSIAVDVVQAQLGRTIVTGALSSNDVWSNPRSNVSC